MLRYAKDGKLQINWRSVRRKYPDYSTCRTVSNKLRKRLRTYNCKKLLLPLCYMCENVGSNDEHVPPRCLFPEQKDLPGGIDLRKNLITVPSCDEHNTRKSKDDEYLLYLLVMNLPTNEFGKNQFLSKVMRAIERRPALINQFLEGHEKISIKDIETGKVQSTIAVNIDDYRFNNIMDMMARALFFHHRNERWFGKISIQPDFLIHIDKPAVNAQIAELARAADLYFVDAERFGDNQEVFNYQIVEGDYRCPFLMRLCFYDNCKVTAFIGLNG